MAVFIPTDFTIQQPADVEILFQKLLDRTIHSTSEFENFLIDVSELESFLSEDMAWRYIHMTCDTQNEDFENAYCIITYQSTLAIEAILRGIPSFCNEVSCAAPVSTTELNLNKIKFPTMLEIENWVTSLLANQFTMEEFKNGVAFEAINRLQNQKYII